MTEIKQTIKIKAPVNEVFKYTSNYKNWPEYYTGLYDVKPITKNTSSNGSQFIYKMKVNGINFRLGTEFQNFRKNEGWNGKSFKGVEHLTQWFFKDDHGGTEFTHALHYKLPWYMGGKLYDYLFGKPSWIKIIENAMQNVKRKMESGNTNKT